MYEIREDLVMKNKIMLFGAGVVGKEAYENLSKKHCLVGFIDNNSALVGKKIFGLPIILPQELSKYFLPDISIIITSIHYIAIAKQLESMGISDFLVYLDGVLYKKHKKGNEIKRCKRCIMDDSSDDTILFDNVGYCNYCNSAINNKGKLYFPNKMGEKKLKDLLKKVKQAGNNKKYDCVMGLSGGLDSSYLAYLGYKWRLKVLVIHLDDGFDTEISKSNIKKIIDATGFDYEVIKPDKEQYNDLILSYMKAGVPNIAVPQDNIVLAYIYKKMEEYNILYFFSGGNYALECILQKGNTYSNLDVDNIRNIYKKFGTKSIDKIELISSEQVKRAKEQQGIEEFRPLNYVEYNRKRAFQELKNFCGFEYYGGKHLENTLTAFIQLYWFTKRFGVDKRTSHLSSLIVSNQLTREEALKEASEALCDQKEMDKYISIIKDNLKISDDEFIRIMSAPIHQHEEYR